MNKTVLVVILACHSIFLMAQKKTENVVLVTLDGYRWQELFQGAERRLISKDFVNDSAAVTKEFWRDDVFSRRSVLMPFFWSVIAKEGQLYGNRTLGSMVNVTNKQWFSYPGYSEILCGFSDDARVNSNDKNLNENKNVLEFIAAQKGFRGKVAAYSSWDVFPYIINSRRNGIPVNAGIVSVGSGANETERMLDELMFQVPNPLGEVRLDAFTFHYGLEYMKKNKPRVMYFAFDETDDFAHGGKYDLYLESAKYTDGFIKNLWDWCQSDPQYKGKTTMIITVDHGRGSIGKDEWKHHGIKMPNADQIWFAVIGPDTPAMGEIKGPVQLYQNQVAKTIAAFIGLDYKNNTPTGDVIQSMIKSNN
jgi:hypothetical protein